MVLSANLNRWLNDTIVLTPAKNLLTTPQTVTIIGTFMTIATTTPTKKRHSAIYGRLIHRSYKLYFLLQNSSAYLAAELLPYLNSPPSQIKAHSIVIDNIILFIQHVTPRMAPHISVCELSRNILTLNIVGYIPISNFISSKHLFNENYSKIYMHQYLVIGVSHQPYSSVTIAFRFDPTKNTNSKASFSKPLFLAFPTQFLSSCLPMSILYLYY